MVELGLVLEDAFADAVDQAEAQVVTVADVAVFRAEDQCLVQVVHYDLETQLGEGVLDV